MCSVPEERRTMVISFVQDYAAESKPANLFVVNKLTS